MDNEYRNNSIINIDPYMYEPIAVNPRPRQNENIASLKRDPKSLVLINQSQNDGPLGPRGLVEATEMCTQECLVLGHSDNCWMPPALGSYQTPKSPVSTFANQKEWAKEKLQNGHTLTRGWKNEAGRDQFGDRKQFGSGEGHFNSGGHMSDIPLASLKSYQPASGPDSPKEQQL